jgi:RNA polymerase sigma-70 factor (ECF subfamily)
MISDEQLIRQVEKRDEAALMELYQRYGGLVKGLAFRVLQDESMAEEITQDVFLKLWQQPARWNVSIGALSTWLMAITRNAAIDRLRAEKRRPVYSAVPTEDASDQLAQDAVSDDPLWADGQSLRQLLLELPQEQRQLIDLAFFQGMTHSELADGLSLPLGTVKTRLRRGLQRLRELWRESQ